jgi:antitoxin ParD1/3/4
MARNTSILLGDYYDSFVSKQVKTGKFASASEVIRNALRLFEESETAKKNLVKELRKGEQSAIATDFDPDKFLASLHKKYLKK